MSVSFGSVLSAIVQLLPQIIVCKNMCTALFCVVCALPVFIMLFSISTSVLCQVKVCAIIWCQAVYIKNIVGVMNVSSYYLKVIM